MSHLSTFLFRTLHQHWMSIGLAVSIGLIVIAPQLVFIAQSGEVYQGIYMLKTDAEPHYLARMQNALKGNGTSNPFAVEFRDNVPTGFFSYAEEVLILPARVLPVSIPTLNLIYKFLLPVILALLIYALVVRLTASRSWGFVAMVAVVLGSTTFNVGTLAHLFQWDLFYQQFLLLARPVSPIISLIFFAGYLHIALTAHRSRNFAWYLLLGMLAGLAWYFYLYLALLIVALEVSYTVLAVWYKDLIAAIRHLIVLALSVIVGAWGIWSIASITLHPYYEFFIGPIGLQSTRAPYIHDVWLVVVGLFITYVFYNRTFKHTIFLGGLLVASFVVANQQVLTGLSLHPGHFLTYFCLPIYIVVLIVLAANYFVGVRARQGLLLQIALVAYVSIAAAYIQYSSYVEWAPKVLEEQRYALVLAWLDKAEEEEAVVMAHQSLSEFIPAYTRHAVMWEEHANSYLMQKERWDFTPENALRSENFCSFVKQFRLDYIVWDTEKDPSWRIDTKPCAQLITSINDFSIYALP